MSSIMNQIVGSTAVQQTFTVEFVEHFTQCDECQKEFTPHSWNTLIQVRQRVLHKKTFFLLEQLILSHSAHEKCLKIEAVDEGLDFYFKTKSHAMRLVDFLQVLKLI